MKWLCCLILFFASVQAADKEMKILVLTIASDDKPYYVELQKVWRKYMNYDPQHIEAYFIKCDPNLDQPYKIENNIIWIKMEETYIPGLGDKTILAMEAFLPRLKEFDFVLRTNLSSFYVFPRLLQFVRCLPKKRCYHACENQILQGEGKPYIPFGSGAGIIFSPDVVELMVAHKKELLGSTIVDDVLFGYFLHQQKIPLIVATRADILNLQTWLQHKHKIPENQYHFRLKNDEPYRLTHEVQIHSAIADIFYGNHKKEK